MIKNNKVSWIIIVFSIFVLQLIANVNCNAYDEYYDEDEFIYPEEPYKVLQADVGYGSLGLSLAAGFRFSFVSLSIGLTGFTKTIPNYIYPSREFPMPKKGDYVEESYPYIAVIGDAGFYYDIDRLSVFATVGFYSQSDTVLAREIDTGYLYHYKHNATSGVCFGGGFQYLFTEKLLFGIGYHTKRGIFLQAGFFL